MCLCRDCVAALRPLIIPRKEAAAEAEAPLLVRAEAKDREGALAAALL